MKVKKPKAPMGIDLADFCDVIERYLNGSHRSVEIVRYTTDYTDYRVTIAGNPFKVPTMVVRRTLSAALAEAMRQANEEKWNECCTNRRRRDSDSNRVDPSDDEDGRSG